MRAFLATASCLALLGYATPGVAQHMKLRGVALCSYGSAYADGCAGAPVGGSFRINNFAATVTQGGQTSILATHPQPYNVVGNDYGAGHYTPKGLLIDPTVTQPAHCVYSATGNTGGHPRLLCSGAFAMSIKHYDFSKGPEGCIYLKIANGATSVEIEDNFFQENVGCDVTDNVSGLLELQGNMNAPLTLVSNTFDGNYPGYPMTHPSGGLILDNRKGGGATVRKYNAFINAPERPISAATLASADNSFNVYYGWGLDPTSAQHTEVVQDSTPASTTVPTTTYSFNTMVSTNISNAGNGGTGPGTTGATVVGIFSGLTPASTYTATAGDHNTIITNPRLGTGGRTVSRAFWLSLSNFGTVTWTANYIDASGSLYCFKRDGALSIGSTTFTGNISLYDGSSVYGYSDDGAGNFACAGHQ